ncbi:glucose transporter type 1-like isoform X1 [Varroa jacobsoni]|uniref:glucose transporter type 1-like isoform X1 n=3 Tax=Varroa jacobsoni TaxID=62625 RepID=UPI000BF97815|nr:glucose transporter type 1-like isoform X1 [Varroa jacobsoni]XP_022688355.1 glucose transporter type 1-like isoform X1 [Varroa jacobsoni]XP_022688356.1 glucose transporter type 1-like isoform X1 [Varroa jacobsoni]
MCGCSACGRFPLLRAPEGLTCALVLAIFASVLGMFQFGYNIGVVNAPQKIIEDFIQDVYVRRGSRIGPSSAGWLLAITVSIFCIGGMAGGFSGGVVANRFGRKGGMLANNALGIAGGLLMGLAKPCSSFELLILGRLVIGFNCGLNTALVPMYLLEISPLPLRGGLGTVSQVGVTVGMLLSQILGLPVILGTKDGWPYLLAIAVVPAVLQLALLPLCPESPRFLLFTRNQERAAREALEKLRCTPLIEEDIEEMRAEDIQEHRETHVTVIQVLRDRTLQVPLLIGIVMHLSQQLSGINAVFSYSLRLFVQAGLTDELAQCANVGVGVVMVLMTLVSIPLMDRTGRRTLHLYGLGGMFIFSIFITISLLVSFLYSWITYMSVVSTLAFVIFFAIGPGTIPWIYTAELFAQGPRPAAMAVGVLVNWSANFFVSLIFPSMQEAFGDYTFLPFTALLGLFWVFTYRRVPETKNRTFDEIAALFRQQGSESSQSRSHGGGGILSCASAPASTGGVANRGSQAVTNTRSQSQPVTPTCPHQQGTTPGHLIHSGVHNHNHNHIGYGHTQLPQQHVVINTNNGDCPRSMTSHPGGISQVGSHSHHSLLHHSHAAPMSSTGPHSPAAPVTPLIPLPPLTPLPPTIQQLPPPQQYYYPTLFSHPPCHNRIHKELNCTAVVAGSGSVPYMSRHPSHDHL